MGDHDQASEVPEGQKSREVLEGFRKNRNELLRKIPKIDRLMEMESVKAQCELYGYQIVLEAAEKSPGAAAGSAADGQLHRIGRKLPGNWQTRKSC